MSDAWSRSLFEHSLNGILLIDPQTGAILAANPEACRLLGYTETELLRLDRTAIVDAQDARLAAAAAQRERTGQFRGELMYRRSDGALFPVDVSSSLFSEPGGRIVAATFFTDSSERKAAEQATAASQARLAAVLESTSEYIWSIDRSYCLLTANAAFARGVHLQIGRPLAVGESVVDDPFPPASRAFWRPRYDRALAGEAYSFEMASVLHTGVKLVCYLNPIRDSSGVVTGVVGRTVDITAWRQVEVQLRSAVQKLELATAAAELGIWQWDLGSGDLQWDDRTCALFAVLAEVRRRGIDYDFWRACVHPDDLDATERSLAEARRSGSHWQDTYRIVLADGAIRYIQSASIIECGANGQPLSMVGVCRDITVQKQAEEAARLGALEMARALRLKDEFLSNMSHELRTPLSGILSLSEVLEMDVYGPLNERQRRALTLIQSSGHHLLDLINDVLDLSKIAAGKLELLLEPVSVDEACHVSLAFVKGVALEKGVRLNYEIASSQPLYLQADARRLKQMLVNLLSNAIKFTPPGGSVHLSASVDDTAQTVRLRVQDTGIGIKAEDMSKLFQPFSQIDSGPARTQGGTGLGLALVKNLAAQHGGSVEVTSAGLPGLGSSFTIVLPFHEPTLQAADEASSEQVADSALASTLAESGVRVLLAEDNEVTQEVYTGYLHSLGYHVIAAHTGVEALELAQTHHPDIILMDIQMPLLDGFEVMRRLRGNPAFAATPIIALTAFAMLGDRERCLAAGATDYVSKPVALGSLALLMARLLSRAAGTTHTA